MARARTNNAATGVQFFFNVHVCIYIYTFMGQQRRPGVAPRACGVGWEGACAEEVKRTERNGKRESEEKQKETETEQETACESERERERESVREREKIVSTSST